MRRLLKFLHTVGAVGLMGGMAVVAVVLLVASPSIGPAAYGFLMDALAKVAAWVILPSMTVTVVAGLLSVAVTPGFHDAGWVWAKAATGILIFEGALHVVGPLQEEAKRGAGAIAAAIDPASVARLFTSERNTLWVLIAVSAANIALGVWRPRFPRIPF